MSRFMGRVPRVFTFRAKQPSSPYALVSEIASTQRQIGIVALVMSAVIFVSVLSVATSNWRKSPLDEAFILFIPGVAWGVFLGYFLVFLRLGGICRRSLESLNDGSDSPLDERPPESLDPQP